MGQWRNVVPWPVSAKVGSLLIGDHSVWSLNARAHIGFLLNPKLNLDPYPDSEPNLDPNQMDIHLELSLGVVEKGSACECVQCCCSLRPCVCVCVKMNK